MFRLTTRLGRTVRATANHKFRAFAEWRRLDYPQLTPAVAGVLNGQIPVRFIYPGTEQSLNGANYTKAVQHQGADLLTTKLWFDVN